MKASGINLRLDLENQAPILVQHKASILSSAHVTLLTDVKEYYVHEIYRLHARYVN